MWNSRGSQQRSVYPVRRRQGLQSELVGIAFCCVCDLPTSTLEQRWHCGQWTLCTFALYPTVNTLLWTALDIHPLPLVVLRRPRVNLLLTHLALIAQWLMLVLSIV